MTFLDQSQFQLPNIFDNYEVLTTEADYYCLQQMKVRLTMEIRKNSSFIEICQECLSYNRILYITGDVLLLYDLYMNDEERQSYISDRITVSQINRLKLQLCNYKCNESKNERNENSTSKMREIRKKLILKKID